MFSSFSGSSSDIKTPAMDYAYLRQEGIRLLEKMSGPNWTDFNEHDPGITILELLCYAITDLAYRIDFDIKDLLASGAMDPYRSIHTPAGILSTNPVTLTDLRKLILDVPGVKNAWVQQVDSQGLSLDYDPFDEGIHLRVSSSTSSQRELILVRGVYRVLVERDTDSNLDWNVIRTDVNQRIQSCRPLGEDILSPEPVTSQEISLDCQIEIGAVDDADLLMAHICLRLADFISPHIRFYTLDEMFAKGNTIDEIMNGPVLRHGFIDDTELEKLEMKTSIRASDLIQEILKVDGASAVNRIQILSGEDSDDWYLQVGADHAPFFDVTNSLPSIQLSREGVLVQPNPARVKDLLKGMQAAVHQEELLESQRDIYLPAGYDREVGNYYSIQHQFPEVYGIGSMGLPESASPLRKAQAKQLKAYLMFFDQLLANYFAQLENVGELFAFDSPNSPTYFSQVIDDEELGLDEILVNEKDKHAANLQSFTEDPASARARKNRFLDHLLARFAEQFTDLALLQNAGSNEMDLVKIKSEILEAYQEISQARGTGFDITRADSGNKSGLERRISMKLGISEDVTHLAGLDENSSGGFLMLEHILLRPRESEGANLLQGDIFTAWKNDAILAQTERRDPYSHQISFIFPDWIARFNDQGFKSLIEKTLREETPAHLRIYIHWLDQKEMKVFESAYSDWFENVNIGNIKSRDARDRMIQILELGLPYPLRDLKLIYPAMVPFEDSANIQIENAQDGVLYQLCDEDGNPVQPGADGKRFEVQPDAGAPSDRVFLPTPQITEDVIFTILAIREGGDPKIRLEVYLIESVFIRSGIDTDLPVTFHQDVNQVVADNAVITDYDTPVTVNITNRQAGITYKLVAVSQDGTAIVTTLPQQVDEDVIALTSTDKFIEDEHLKVLAYRTSRQPADPDTIPDDAQYLTAELFVKVRPNTAVSVSVDSNILDYETEAAVSLTGFQISADYSLYKRELTAVDYLSEADADALTIKNGRKNIFIKKPSKVTDWETADGFALIGTFTANKKKLSISTGALQEDSIFIVRATKTENKESVQLDQAFAVLVRPKTSLDVGVVDAVVESGTSGTVTISNTQKGVSYQLQVDDAPVNEPGFDVSDRGVGTTRIEVDFIVEERGDAILRLPTDAITKMTKFSILATKIFTGLDAQLDRTVTIKRKAAGS